MAETRLSLCVNLRTGATTQYQNYNFDSFALVGNRVFAVDSDGIYSLDDSDVDDTTPIDAFFRGPLTDFGSQYKKCFMKAFLGYEADGLLRLDLTADERHHMAAVPAIGETRQHGALYALDREVRGRFWEPKISNMDGCDFAVDSLLLIPQFGKPYPFFNKVTGLMTRSDPVRAQYDPKKGLYGLTEAVNCDIDDTGRITRRKGFTLQSSGVFHSAVSDGQNAYVILEGSGSGTLVKINYDASITTVVTGLTSGLPMHGAFAGGSFYWQNSMQQGVVTGRVNGPWAATQPIASELATPRQYYSPPNTAGPMCSFEGRILASDHATVWHSEWLSYSRFRLSTGYLQFGNDVTLLAPVNEGIWASDGQAVYFLRYERPGEYPVFNRITATNYGAIAGTLGYADAGQILDGSLGLGPVAIFSTTNGVCIGTSQGTFRNLTEEKIIFPYATSGAGVVINRTNAPGLPIRYIVSLNP